MWFWCFDFGLRQFGVDLKVLAEEWSSGLQRVGIVGGYVRLFLAVIVGRYCWRDVLGRYQWVVCQSPRRTKRQGERQ